MAFYSTCTITVRHTEVQWSLSVGPKLLCCGVAILVLYSGRHDGGAVCPSSFTSDTRARLSLGKLPFVLTDGSSISLGCGSYLALSKPAQPEYPQRVNAECLHDLRSVALHRAWKMVATVGKGATRS